ncbi:MAG: SRPBCC domain-containing protein [Nitrosopumilus sp.]|nr:SRPBCC domain-containing protein [Nitrosopumilus sp.]
MKKDLVIRKTVKINVNASKVWNALTNPKMIKKYLFGTKVITAWKVGSEIIFQGNWKEKKFRDKGIIEKFEIEKLFQYTYWSIFSGLEDKEENYSLVTFELSGTDKITKLTVSQQGFADKASQEHSDKGWSMVLQKIKELVEE